MTVPNPFTYSNVITATMDVLNKYPEDAYASSAKAHLSRLRRRLGYSAPKVVEENFWSSSSNYEGYYDICRAFDHSDTRSKEMFGLYIDVLQKFRADGFESFHVASGR
jgi:hypothetical protein